MHVTHLKRMHTVKIKLTGKHEKLSFRNVEMESTVLKLHRQKACLVLES